MTTGASSGSSGVGSGSSRSRVVVAADIANAIEAELGDFVADHSSTLSMFEAQEKLQYVLCGVRLILASVRIP